MLWWIHVIEWTTSYLQNTIGCPIFVTDDPINTVSAGLMILLSRMED